MNFIFRLILSLYIVFLCGCGDIDGSIFGDDTDSTVRDQNNKAMQALTDNGGDLVFALISDSHGNHTDLEAVIKNINRGSFDFVIHLGDITNTAYGMEFDLFADVIKKLNMPYFITMGNHDAIQKGPDIFRKLFGPDNYAFVFKGFKFIVINNVRECKTLNYDWIASEVQATSLPVLVFQHIPPFDDEVFDDYGRQIHTAGIGIPNVKAVFYGHNHRFESEFFENKLMQMVGRTEGRHYTTVKVSGDTMEITGCYADRCDEKVYYNLASD